MDFYFVQRTSAVCARNRRIPGSLPSENASGDLDRDLISCGQFGFGAVARVFSSHPERPESSANVNSTNEKRRPHNKVPSPSVNPNTSRLAERIKRLGFVLEDVKDRHDLGDTKDAIEL